MSVVVPVALVIGIIEDKIANDLSSSDDKVKEHLEDLKHKIIKNKTKKKVLEVKYKDGSLVTEVADDIIFKGNFIIFIKENEKIYLNSNEIKHIKEVENG